MLLVTYLKFCLVEVCSLFSKILYHLTQHYFSSKGGMKAVLWTDVFQAILMFLGILAVLIKGIIDVGGIVTVYERAYDGGRLTVPG